ncbi:uncharacterized protein PV09_06181 [Verruconis gallopava]|uniref:NAD(P)-binding protein n=1 Tax=Verruconis gallopava TaxID=253628 RepID=A0A0D2AT84_9PEZI|nr:uncharacterized protein PV09_06181 [Verruconis gallopava]KIW02359.1 hypothetical protein PV09_06181 [Verruconis gallopava]
MTMGASPNQTIILVVGGNSGIGFELANQLLADENKLVLLGCRSIVKGKAAVERLQSRNLAGSVQMIQVDIDSKESIAAAAQNIEEKYGRLDALVNSAGIAWLPDMTVEEKMMTAFRTNAVGAWLLGEAMVPLLKKSSGTARLVNVSSGAGSVHIQLKHGAEFKSPTVHYNASKAALNMINAVQSTNYGPKVKVFAYCPGFTVSNLSPFCKAENGAKPTFEAVKPMLAILNGDRDAENGGFLIGGMRGREHQISRDIHVGEDQLPW